MPTGRLAITSSRSTRFTLEGRELLSFAGCNYLGLAHHPRVLAALADGCARYGLSSAASRETSGNTLAHETLERDLARFTGFEAALLVPDGYLSNLVIAQALAPECTSALVDAQAHVSVHDALAGAQIPTHTYAHANADAARRTLERVGSERPAIFTDAVFPARGHCAPLAELLELLPERGVLVVDDCHGFGVLGAHGRGTLEELLLHDPRLVLTGTLSKAFGCFGGFIAGSRALIDQARTRSRAYVGSTPIPPALALAGSAALAQLALEPERLARLRDNIELLRATFRKLGLETHALRHPVFALKRATPEDMDVAYRTFLSEGLLVPYIQYPDGLGGYLRISLCADHSADDVTRLGATLQKVLA